MSGQSKSRNHQHYRIHRAASTLGQSTSGYRKTVKTFDGGRKNKKVSKQKFVTQEQFEAATSVVDGLKRKLDSTTTFYETAIQRIQGFVETIVKRTDSEITGKHDLKMMLIGVGLGSVVTLAVTVASIAVTSHFTKSPTLVQFNKATEEVVNRVVDERLPQLNKAVEEAVGRAIDKKFPNLRVQEDKTPQKEQKPNSIPAVERMPVIVPKRMDGVPEKRAGGVRPHP
ncbi:MAG: hypothetical protein FWF24_07725 [Alphaproteobacteria bacterium]|nr:hypothetical protein [Alphaproteobacteria bacterium]